MATTESSLPSLMPSLRTLSRADKLRVIQLLADDLAREEGIPTIKPGASFPIWTPFDAFDAAAKLFEELKKAESLSRSEFPASTSEKTPLVSSSQLY